MYFEAGQALEPNGTSQLALWGEGGGRGSASGRKAGRGGGGRAGGGGCGGGGGGGGVGEGPGGGRGGGGGGWGFQGRGQHSDSQTSSELVPVFQWHLVRRPTTHPSYGRHNLPIILAAGGLACSRLSGPGAAITGRWSGCGLYRPFSWLGLLRPRLPPRPRRMWGGGGGGGGGGALPPASRPRPRGAETQDCSLRPV